MPISIPSGVEVGLEGIRIRVKGPKGALERNLHPEMRVAVSDDAIKVERPSDSKKHRSLHGLTRSLIANMVEGVTKGYEKHLEIQGVGYRATLQGKKLSLSVGYSHLVEIDPPEGIEIEVPQPTRIGVRGIDKELVGAVAARIRAVREPEPYLGKGIKYADERIKRKAGKAGKVTAG